MARSVAEVALMWSVLAEAPIPRASLAGLRVGLLTRPPVVGGTPLRPNRSAEQYAAHFEALGAEVVEAEIPEPPGDTWPLFNWEAAESHRSTFPARAAEYGANVRAKLEAAQGVAPDEAAGARRAVRRWRAYRPPFDLYLSPVVRRPLPAEDCDELEVRLDLSAFLRPFNVLGWAALAIGDVQLAAPSDERVLAAGLAWEAATG